MLRIECPWCGVRDEPEFTWEHVDKAAALKADAGVK